MAGSVLLIDDDVDVLRSIGNYFERLGYEVTRELSGEAGLATFDRLRPEVVILDLFLPGMNGMEVLESLRQRDAAVILLTAEADVSIAVRAMQLGAENFLTKPVDMEHLAAATARVADKARLRRINEALLVQSAPGHGLDSLGSSSGMQDFAHQVGLLAQSERTTVLLNGESGTGKGWVARMIHDLSPRSRAPFVEVNCAGLNATFLDSELFGHEKGAFTGAVGRSIGKFEQAHGGTLFLDEIGDMPPEAQTRLLRALQSGRIRRVGGRDEIAIDVRIIAATNRDLAPMIAAGKFREDLFYRLNVVPIQLPPLRERAGDIEALARHFLRLATAEGLPARRLSKQAAALLEAQPWRGNVRELRNFIFRAALLSREDEIDAPGVRQLLADGPISETPGGTDFAAALATWLSREPVAHGSLYHGALAAFEKPLFEHALRETGGNQLRAAQLLGINRNTLRKRLDDLRIDPEEFVRRG
jgi:two-component system nitrogen regulation response regulator GlnG